MQTAVVRLQWPEKDLNCGPAADLTVSLTTGD